MQKINQEIIKTISDFLEENPEIRFTQMLHILNLINSEFMEKPQDTLRKINTKIKERCEVTKM